MGGKAKPKKHTAKEMAKKAKFANQNKGGGKAGAADRKGGKAGHAKLKCPICMQQAPDLKSMRMHWDSKHGKIEWDETKFEDQHKKFGGTVQGVAVKGSGNTKKTKRKTKAEKAADKRKAKQVHADSSKRGSGPATINDIVTGDPVLTDAYQRVPLEGAEGLFVVRSKMVDAAGGGGEKVDDMVTAFGYNARPAMKFPDFAKGVFKPWCQAVKAEILKAGNKPKPFMQSAKGAVGWLKTNWGKFELMFSKSNNPASFVLAFWDDEANASGARSFVFFTHALVEKKTGMALAASLAKLKVAGK